MSHNQPWKDNLYGKKQHKYVSLLYLYLRNVRKKDIFTKKSDFLIKFYTFNLLIIIT